MCISYLFLEDLLAHVCAALFHAPGQFYVTMKTTMRLVLHKQRVSVCLISNIMTMWINSPGMGGHLYGGHSFWFWGCSRFCFGVSCSLCGLFISRLHRFCYFTSKAPSGACLLCSIILTFLFLLCCWRHCFGCAWSFPVLTHVLWGELLCVAIALSQLPPSFCLVASNSLSLGLWRRALQGVYSIHYAVRLGLRH